MAMTDGHPAGESAAYRDRRAALLTYFDRTAIEGWKAFATDRPVSRIRETVRAGRTAMRELILAQLPADLDGWRVLDAGCGTGAMTVELARRGASVVAVDLSPGQIEFASQTWPREVDRSRVRFVDGDMLDPAHGRFDAVVAMDSLIHYRMADAVAALVRLEARTARRIVFTHAPATGPLRAMHAAGKLMPRGDRSPAIVPTPSLGLRRALGEENARRLWDGTLACRWAVGATRRVSSGFYTSQMVVLHSGDDSDR